MKKDVQIDGLKKETILLDDQDKQIVVKEEVNIDSHLKNNKALIIMIYLISIKII